LKAAKEAKDQTKVAYYYTKLLKQYQSTADKLHETFLQQSMNIHDDI